MNNIINSFVHIKKNYNEADEWMTFKIVLTFTQTTYSTLQRRLKIGTYSGFLNVLITLFLEVYFSFIFDKIVSCPRLNKSSE